ncbi:molybdopterin oxidoreductase family protein [Polycladomyces sp. WAk]|uniref:Molybdopterin oxidoreductase family protein n=1 Tax=Polycladomyces zharkentensis TaxID=2807616 RepID=A0ABS2WM22_9BACL|nr:molybdopterin oxidoreductase family protein [Polycladomyces sp. WAk]
MWKKAGGRNVSPSTREIFRSVCPLDCPDTCGLRVTVEDGRITRVTGDPDHPITRGVICHKVRYFPARVHHPERLLYPMRRTGRKGEGKFERITWEEALDEITSRMKNLIAEYGAESILPYSYYGNMGLVNNGTMDRRFFHRLGATRLERTICNAAGSQGFRATMGIKGAIDPEDTVHSRYIIVWGGNIVSTNMHQVMLFEQARKQGAKIVVIDVHRNQTARWADEFVQLYPGTDAALALGMMHVLERENLIDEAFLRDHTVGWEQLKERLKTYPPERVSRITGVPKETIIRLAREYGKTSPSLIRIGNGLQHHDNGGMIVRTITCLPALTGQWQYKGGGALKENGLVQVDTDKLERPDLLPDPDVRSINMIQLGSALLEADPPIRMLFVYNSNPAAVAPSQEKVLRGLAREDLFTVVHDLFLTDTARYADLVLPATSHFENLDVYKSYWHMYVQVARPILPPQGEAWSNYKLFRTLAKRMGFTEPCFDDTEEDLIRQVLDNPENPCLSRIDFDELMEKEIVKLDLSENAAFPERLQRGIRIQLFNESLRAQGLDPLPAHIALKEGTDGERNAKDPDTFMLISPPNHQYLNSSMGNIPKLQKMEGRPTLQIHPKDAERKGIVDGSLVRIRNERGSCTLTAKVTDAVLPGVLVSMGLWWLSSYPDGKGINQLTPDREADMGGGAVFFSTAVQLEKAE